MLIGYYHIKKTLQKKPLSPIRQRDEPLQIHHKRRYTYDPYDIHDSINSTSAYRPYSFPFDQYNPNTPRNILPPSSQHHHLEPLYHHLNDHDDSVDDDDDDNNNLDVDELKHDYSLNSKPKIWSLADTAACKTPPPPVVASDSSRAANAEAAGVWLSGTTTFPLPPTIPPSSQSQYPRFSHPMTANLPSQYMANSYR